LKLKVPESRFTPLETPVPLERSFLTGFTIAEEEFSFSAIALVELMQATLAKGIPFRFKVKGFSMRPFIRDSDVVTVSPVDNSSISLGEPVAFIHPGMGKLVIHRIVAKKGHYYLIKGDSTSGPDGLFSGENILGCVTKVERNGKDFFLGLGKERPLIALLSRALFFYLLLFMWNFVKCGIRKFTK